MSKTGTTALQSCLVRNRKYLSDHGICYTGYSELAPQHVNIGIAVLADYIEKNYGHVLIKPHAFSAEVIDPPDMIIDRIKNSFSKSNHHTLIISSEFFYSPVFSMLDSAFSDDGSYSPPFDERTDYFINYMREAFNEFDVKVVAYIRRQDKYLESNYNQFCRDVSSQSVNEDIIKLFKGSAAYSKENKITSCIIDELINDLPSSLSILSHWASVFGKGNIIVRPFEKQQLPNGIEYDFFVNVLGKDNKFTSRLDLDDANANISVSKDILEYKLATELFDLSEFFIELNSNPNLLYLMDNKKNILTSDKAISLLAHFKKDNEKIAKEYLGRDDGTLFYEPTPDPKDDYLGLSLDAALDISKELVRTIQMKDKRLSSSLFINFGNGFSEYDRLHNYVEIDNYGGFFTKFTIGSRISNIVGLRFDPDENRLWDISIDCVTIDGTIRQATPTNSIMKIGDFDSFLTYDPIYLIDAPHQVNTIEISGKVRPVSTQKLELIKSENVELAHQNTELGQSLDSYEIDNSRLNDEKIRLQSQLADQVERTQLLEDELNMIKRSRLLRFFSKFGCMK